MEREVSREENERNGERKGEETFAANIQHRGFHIPLGKI